jgi:hypothetical protein
MFCSQSISMHFRCGSLRARPRLLAHGDSVCMRRAAVQLLHRDGTAVEVSAAQLSDASPEAHVLTVDALKHVDKLTLQHGRDPVFGNRPVYTGSGTM